MDPTRVLRDPGADPRLVAWDAYVRGLVARVNGDFACARAVAAQVGRGVRLVRVLVAGGARPDRARRDARRYARGNAAGARRRHRARQSSSSTWRPGIPRCASRRSSTAARTPCARTCAMPMPSWAPTDVSTPWPRYGRWDCSTAEPACVRTSVRAQGASAARCAAWYSWSERGGPASDSSAVTSARAVSSEVSDAIEASTAARRMR